MLEAKKVLYDLEQSAGEWCETLSRLLFAKEFLASSFCPSDFLHVNENVYISVYVDAIALFGLLSPFVEKTIEFMKEDFDVKDFGIATWLLAIHIQYKRTISYYLREAT